MWPIFKTEALIYQSNATLDENVLFGKITHLLDPKTRNMSVLRGLLRNQEFHVPFWSMIYLPLKFKLNGIVSFINGF